MHARPPVPVLGRAPAGCARVLALSSFGLRGLGAGHRRRRDVRGRPGARLGTAAGRDRAQPARAARRDISTDGARRRDRVRVGPVRAADDAGRGLSVAARHAGGHRLGRVRIFAAAVSQLPWRRAATTPASMTGVRIEIEGEIVTLAATDRYRLGGARAELESRHWQLSAAALVLARTLADTAKSLTGGAEVTDRPGGREHRRRHDRLRVRWAPHDDPAARRRVPKYRSLLPPTPRRARVRTPPRWPRPSSASHWWRRATPRCGSASAAASTLEAGGGDDAHARKRSRRRTRANEMTIAFNPTYLLDGLGGVRLRRGAPAFTTPTKPAAVLTGKVAGDYRPPADAGPPRGDLVAALTTVTGGCVRHDVLADFAGGRSATRDHRSGPHGRQHEKRLGQGGHQVVGFDRNPEVSDVGSIEELLDVLRRRARGGSWCRPGKLITVPPSPALGDRLDAGDIVIDGGNAATATSIRHAAELKEKGIGFVDVGVSGGVWGLTEGYALMVGGDAKTSPRCSPSSTPSSPREIPASCTPARSAPATSPRWSTTASSTD